MVCAETGNVLGLDVEEDDPVSCPSDIVAHCMTPLWNNVNVGEEVVSVPFHKANPRLIVYEMKRRKVSSMPSIPEDSVLEDDVSESEMSTVGPAEDGFEAEESECSMTTDFMMTELSKRISDNDTLREDFSKWFQVQHLDRQKRFYKHVNALVVKGNGYLTEYNRLLTLLTGSHTAALPLGSSEQALAAMFYLTVSARVFCATTLV